jgi:hypothetical protein
MRNRAVRGTGAAFRLRLSQRPSTRHTVSRRFFI